MNEQRYIPAHHPACSCEMCMLVQRAGGPQNMHEDERRRAVAWMNRYGKIMRTSVREPGQERRAGMDSMAGKTVHFQWAVRDPDLTGTFEAVTWRAATAAKVLALDRGALLLHLGDDREVAARWWPLRSFAWIEAVTEAPAP